MSESKALQLGRLAGLDEVELVQFEYQSLRYKHTLEDKVEHTQLVDAIRKELNQQLIPIIKFVNMILVELWAHLKWSKCCGHPLPETKSDEWAYIRCAHCHNRLNTDGTLRD